MEATPISVKPPSPAAPPATVEPRASPPAAGAAEGGPCAMNQLALTPNPKRQKVEEAADGNGCKHCACKKSRCLKLRRLKAGSLWPVAVDAEGSSSGGNGLVTGENDSTALGSSDAVSDTEAGGMESRLASGSRTD